MKKLILVLPLLISLLFVKAQFGPQNILSPYYRALNGVKFGDLDLDGDDDVVWCTGYGNFDSFGWLENLGNGEYSFKNNIIGNNSVNGYSNPALYDVDIDGDIDVIINSSMGCVWYENLGSGLFSSTSNLIAGVPQIGKLLDIDNDGLVDITYDNVWHKNMGGFTFSSANLLQYTNYPIFTDLNSDGLLDYLYFDDIGYNTLMFVENTGNGNFTTSTPIIYSIMGQQFTNFFFNDIDNDNDQDIFCMMNGDLYWSKNNGSMSFGSLQVIDNTTWFVYGVNNMIAQDLNGDGYGDLILGESSGSVRKYSYNGSSFTGPTNLKSANSSVEVEFHDIDNDGDQDITRFTNDNSGNSSIGWYENNGGIFTKENVITEWTESPTAIASADLNGDGLEDIIYIADGSASTSNHQGKFAWCKNMGNNQFSGHNIITETDNLYRGFFDCGDMDNDGDIDIVVSTQQYLFFVAKNDGLGNFVTIGLPKTTNFAGTAVHLGDLDGDGDLDIIASSIYATNPGLFVSENLGAMNFGPQVRQAITKTQEFDLVDLDVDGDLDIIYAPEFDTIVCYSENLGGLSFTPKDTIATIPNSNMIDIEYADIDLDSLPDVIIGNYSGTLSWFKNQGSGTLGMSQFIDTGVAFLNYKSKDIDGDGDLDIITSSLPNSILFYENLNLGLFDSKKVITTDIQYWSFRAHLELGDLDQDGDYDLLITSSQDHKIAWQENFFDSRFQFRGNLYYDQNQNQVRDTNEMGLTNISVNSSPVQEYSFTTNNGDFIISLDSGLYTIQPNIGALWSLTTDSVTYTRLVNSATPSMSGLDFGYYPNSFQTELTTNVTGAFPRCSSTINYWLNFMNNGTTIPHGVVHLNLDNNLIYISSAITPDSIIGQDIYWHFDSLFFFAEENFNLQVQMPPFTSIGDTLTSILNVYELDGSNNIVYTNSDTLNQVLVCAYDPNDKTVLPKGIGSQGFIANNQPLEYLIRFQNTGNDTALTVMVRDQLDDNLDWASLKPLASSHPMQVWIEQDGEAVFKFNNIMLPDSNVDFLGSQGFVKFSINQKPNLAPNIPIFNTGHIYFDFNPAVITNTVLNTIEDTTSFPVTVQEIAFTETNEIIVFPNPFTEHITIYYKANINTTYHVSLYDMSGKEIMKKENNTSNKTELDVSQLNNGIYIIVGTDTNGKKLFSEQIVAQ